jgi:hypothetical protein
MTLMMPLVTMFAIGEQRRKSINLSSSGGFGFDGEEQ